MLPALRGELSLHPGPAAADGSPTWTIRDPVRHRFFRISWLAFEILSRWNAGTPATVAAAVSAETTIPAIESDVMGVAEFLLVNQLTVPANIQDVQRLATRAIAGRQSWWQWLLHHYLFFRIPLVRPNRWLDRLLPLVWWLGSGWFRMASVIALVFGLMLAGRQWDLFVATLVDTFSLSGLLSYGVALASVKVVHELAHALTAKHHGCRVPAMGVAFLVMWPMLYTDVNDSWMLPERRKRLQVASAGIAAELSVAAWATLAWAFLPQGPWREGAFVLATLTWVSSLAINLSPFMRFDGYFIVMDALEAPNLHPRSFAMARWWLRETLFGLGAPPPEGMTAGRRAGLVLFAFAVWTYRLSLFLGIAILVYHFFIKAVGVMLFAVEIGWFVLLPIWSEVKVWWKLRTRIAANRRTRWATGALAALLLFALMPLQGQVSAPAMVKAERMVELYLPFSARLSTLHVHHGQSVHQGETLMTFTTPDIDQRRAVIQARVAGKQAELEAATLDPSFRERSGIAQEDLRQAQAELAALEAESARLTLVAPMDGTVVDLLPDMRPGDWLSPHQKLSSVVTGAAAVAIAYVAEDDLSRIASGAKATFTPRQLERRTQDGQVERIDPSPAKTIIDAALSSIHHGPIPSRVSGKQIVPEGAYTRVTIRLDPTSLPREAMGTVNITAERSSMVGRLFRSVMVVLVREWGV